MSKKCLTKSEALGKTVRAINYDHCGNLGLVFDAGILLIGSCTNDSGWPDVWIFTDTMNLNDPQLCDLGFIDAQEYERRKAAREALQKEEYSIYAKAERRKKWQELEKEFGHERETG